MGCELYELYETPTSAPPPNPPHNQIHVGLLRFAITTQKNFSFGYQNLHCGVKS